jgi:tripartite-type tricarboxylate transporter receptor subunit TctC
MSMEVRNRIAADFRKVVAANPDISKKLELTGQIVTNRGPAEFGAATQEQRDKLVGLAKLLGLKKAQ